METIEIMKSVQPAQNLVMESMNEAWSKVYKNGNSCNLEIKVFDKHNMTFDIMGNLVDITELIPANQFSLQVEAKKADIINDMNYYRSVFVTDKNSGNTITNGFLIVG